MDDTTLHLVLIAGINNSATLWDEMASNSPPWLELHLIDCPPLDNVNDIATVLLKDLPDQFYLCGFSFGGYVALAMLAAAQQRIQGLILTNTHEGTDTAGQVKGRQQAIQIASEGGYKAFVAGQANKVFHPDSATKKHLQVTREKMVNEYGEQRFMAHLTACITRPDSAKILSACKIPALVVAGADDLVIPQETQKKMALNIPNCTYHVIERAGHMMPLEKSTQFSQLVFSWLANQRST